MGDDDDVVPEAVPTKAAKPKKKCRFGFRCNRKNCKYIHPSPPPRAAGSRGSTTKQNCRRHHHQAKTTTM